MLEFDHVDLVQYNHVEDLKGSYLYTYYLINSYQHIIFTDKGGTWRFKLREEKKFKG